MNFVILNVTNELKTLPHIYRSLPIIHAKFHDLRNYFKLFICDFLNKNKKN